MAKSNFLASMKAKPNARGKRSHLPLHCSTVGCEEDFLVSYINTYPPIRQCNTHATFLNPPQVSEKDQLTNTLRLLGAIA